MYMLGFATNPLEILQCLKEAEGKQTLGLRKFVQTSFLLQQSSFKMYCAFGSKHICIRNQQQQDYGKEFLSPQNCQKRKYTVYYVGCELKIQLT